MVSAVQGESAGMGVFERTVGAADSCNLFIVCVDFAGGGPRLWTVSSGRPHEIPSICERIHGDSPWPLH